MDHLKEIDDWLQKLPVTERLRLNHPSSVWRRWKAATREPDYSEPKPSPMQKLKDELINVIEERDRYKREYEHGGGGLWSPQDRPQDIAKVIVSKLTKSKAKKVAQAILEMLSGASDA
jgi:hypothetical protein